MKMAVPLHPDKPSVCWMYPFASYIEIDSKSTLSVHAKFQFTGDCPGFYVDKSMDSMMPILKEYSTRIFSHNMASIRAKRQGYSAASSVRLGKAQNLAKDPGDVGDAAEII